MMDVDTFLEHHGVKGQRWGIRNEKKSNAPHSPISKKKKAIIISSAATIAVGISALSLVLSKNRKVSIKNVTIKKTMSEGEAVHKKIMKEIAEKNIRLINDANDHLRINDNKLNIPHPQRVVLKTDYWKKILES